LDPKWRGRLVRIADENKIQTILEGPKFTTFKEKKSTSIPLEIEKDLKNKTVTIRIQNQTIKLREDEFSPWIRLEFSVDFFTKIRGIAKFYLKQEEPDLELYLSPLNFDPNNPVYPISSPKDYIKELAKEYGLFSTLGLPNDTWALEENIFSEKTFLKQVDDVQNERKKIILGELKKFKNGLFFGYFGVTDTQQHMYWRFLNHSDSKYQNTILKYYQEADEIVGEAMKSLKNDDVLIALSDHGFDEYSYEININTWLRENGYLTLSDGNEEGGPLLEGVDWSKTKAYAMGYNGIFINRKGREGQGIVLDNETNELEKEIAEKLMKITNPNTGEQVMKKIYTKKDLEISDDSELAPDLFLGYYKGIRSSWDTAVGASPKELILKRKSKWSGDHLFDPSEVPGVLFMNTKIKEKNPRLIDVIPTVLKLFNISGGTYRFDGKNLL
jgi:predicted AlkP superfamily phosphohydrolase/phosphomutase